MQISYIIINYIIMSIGGVLMTLTVHQFLPIRKGWIYRLVPGILFAVALGLPSWIGDENPMFLLPFFMGVFLLCYTGSWYARLIMGIIFYTLLMSLNMMIDTMRSNILHSVGINGIYLAHNFLKLLIWLILLTVVKRVVSRSKKLVLVPRLWMLLGGLSLAPFFAVFSLTIWNSNSFGKEFYYDIVPRMAYTVLPFACLSALSLLVTFLVLSNYEELKQAKAAAEISDIYYQGINREHTEVRIIRHDLRNHITVVQSRLEQGDSDGAIRYLEKLGSSPALTGRKRYCENEIANAVLTIKAAVMEQEKIQADLAVTLPTSLPVPDVELCALLGNALDNAIEAAKTAREKYIMVRARADKGMLMLQVQNAMGVEPLLENGAFKTTKSDTASHGFGLAAMREIAERYGGLMEADVRQGQFELIVCLPLPAEG